jgi:glutathione synthase/RimK-type ligase-like ATP-grasp enzyme
MGIVFHPRKLERIIKQEEEKENIGFYLDLAKEKGYELLCYTLDGIQKEKGRVNGFVYSDSLHHFSETEADLPKVNLLRTLIHNKATYDELKKLQNQWDSKFVNLTLGRNKYSVYRYIRDQEELSHCVPDTEKLSFNSLKKYLSKYNNIVIKPTNGAFGERIFKIGKVNHLYLAEYTFRRKQYKKWLNDKNLTSFYNRFFRPYPGKFIVQQWIPFKKWEEQTFDIRTSVQKNEQGQWEMTGIVSRVASPHGIVTNIAQGGRAISFKNVAEGLKSGIIDEIELLSIKIAKALEALNPDTTDLGLDIGIDQEKRLWFIEANYCDERYSYRESGDLEMWHSSYRKPFEYACSLYEESIQSERGKCEKEVNEKSEENKNEAYDE